ncbi:MAG: hypothetical protein KAT66_00440 [Candidatus Lokiarchaeota archaeon]|nr:hypothetical protein [Candidatus Lokiarchaeota archaeon]
MNDQNYELPSREELKNQDGEYDAQPIEAEDYIVKIGKIIPELKPVWNNKTKSFDASQLKFVYTLILLPYSLKSGDAMKDVDGKDVAIYGRWIWREVNPFSIGFQPDNATPSFMRALICYVTGQDVQGRIKPEGFVLLDKAQRVVTDEALRNKFLAEMKLEIEERTMVKEGYKSVPDIKAYEGDYIGCSIEVDAKGRNKVSRFSKLPKSFEPEEDKEKLEKFEESVLKMQEKKEKKNVDGVSEPKTEKVDTESEVEVDDGLIY